MKYEYFSASDLAQDHFFQQWVLGQDEQAEAYWSQWIQEHPERRKQVDEAIEIITAVEMDGDISLNHDFIASWQTIYSQTIGKKKQQVNYRMVAMWVGLLMFSIAMVYWVSQSDKQYYLAAEGSSSSHELPDGSHVILNSKATLTYRLNSSNTREVWLEGEAFFDVKRWQPEGDVVPSKFIIHTQRAEIEVLGTSFNLEANGHRTQLVLHTGKVRMLSPDQEAVEVQPGELVEVKEGTLSVVKKTVDTRLYSSWVDNKVVFDQTPLRNIVQWIEDKYDREVVLLNEDLASVTFTATIPNVDLEVLLEALALTYQVKITTQGNKIIIGS